MPIRAVLFDLDDTLIDHSYATVAATRAAIALEPALSAAKRSFLDHLDERGIALAIVSNTVVAALLEPTDRRQGGRTGRLDECANLQSLFIVRLSAVPVLSAYSSAYELSDRHLRHRTF